jgi:hypothetical protein
VDVDLTSAGESSAESDITLIIIYVRYREYSPQISQPCDFLQANSYSITVLFKKTSNSESRFRQILLIGIRNILYKQRNELEIPYFYCKNLSLDDLFVCRGDLIENKIHLCA